MFQQYALSGILVDGFSSVLSWITLAVLLFEVFAFVDSLFRRADAFPAVDKQTKPFWMIILGLAVAVSIVPIGGFLSSMLVLLGLVAAIVYMVDVRPRVRAITPSRKNKKDDSHMGPYGPW
jgi:hypothetical protein